MAQERLTPVLVDFARTLVSPYTAEEILTRLCDRIPRILPVDGAGVMLVDEADRLHFVAASDDTVRAIETLQLDLGEGPCLAAYEEGEVFAVTDLASDARFPSFGPAAVERGLRSVWSFPMGVDGDTVGALNVYTADKGTCTPADQEAAQLLADVATGYLFNAQRFERSARLTTQLEQALSTRVVIEQAKGMLAERHAEPLDVAFERLRQFARSRGRKIHAVAADVVSGTVKIEDDQ